MIRTNLGGKKERKRMNKKREEKKKVGLQKYKKALGRQRKTIIIK